MKKLRLHTTFVFRVLALATLLAMPLADGLPTSSQVYAAKTTQTVDVKDGLKEATFTLDNVTVTVRTPFLPTWVPTDHPFVTTEAGAASQVATASAPRPARSFTITAVPFGTRPGTEAVPKAQSGGAKTYLNAIRAYRAKYEAEFDPDGPVATLFGRQVVGQVSLLKSEPSAPDQTKRPVLIVEWVVEAGPRLWIVRIAREEPDGMSSIEPARAFLHSLEELVLSSTTLDQPSTLIGRMDAPSVPPTGAGDQSSSELKEAVVTLDNVTLTIRTPYLPSATFATDAYGATSSNPSGSLSLAVAPFGLVPLGESAPDNPMPAAYAGAADVYRAHLHEYKIKSGGNPQPGPTATLFGQKVPSEATLIQLAPTKPNKEPVLVVDWVVEAGMRIWIVRIERELPEGTQDLSAEQPFLSSLESLVISSNALDSPTTAPPSGSGESTLPGMPVTGWGWMAETGLSSVLAFVAALAGGLLILSGAILRSRTKQGNHRISKRESQQY